MALSYRVYDLVSEFRLTNGTFAASFVDNQNKRVDLSIHSSEDFEYSIKDRLLFNDRHVERL